jgi:hypothetical protein
VIGPNLDVLSFVDALEVVRSLSQPERGENLQDGRSNRRRLLVDREQHSVAVNVDLAVVLG